MTLQNNKRGVCSSAHLFPFIHIFPCKFLPLSRRLSLDFKSFPFMMDDKLPKFPSCRFHFPFCQRLVAPSHFRSLILLNFISSPLTSVILFSHCGWRLKKKKSRQMYKHLFLLKKKEPFVKTRWILLCIRVKQTYSHRQIWKIQFF